MDDRELEIVVQRVVELHREKGRTPMRMEVQASGITAHKITKYGWARILELAGLDKLNTQQAYGLSKKGELTNDIFIRDVREVVESYVPLAPIAKPKYRRMVIIPDTHFPFHNQTVLDAIYAFIIEFQPDLVLQVGDLYDRYCSAKFPRSQNIYKPKEEEDLAIEYATAMWKKIRELCPKARCIQIKGNHDIRPVKRTLEAQPDMEHVVSEHINRIMTFEGVELIKDIREEFIMDDIQFIHGYKSKLGEHRDYALMNTVCGHQHVGGVVFRKIRGSILWELNAGLAGDPNSKALSYTAQKTTLWTPGFGVIDEHGPRFIPV